MAKSTKRVISLLLAAVLIVGTFAGCGKSDKNEPAITASAVKFSKSGKYTTTVSSKKVDLSEINADNVEIRYTEPSAENYLPLSTQGNENQTSEENAEQETISNMDSSLRRAHIFLGLPKEPSHIAP